MINQLTEFRATRNFASRCEMMPERGTKMKMIDRMKERAATGYILLWLLGIPIPILLLIFLLRGCT